MNKTSILELLQETRDTTLSCYSLSPASLEKTYGPGKWSVRQILHHLADVEMMFHVRLKKIVAEPKQVMWAYSPDDWNAAFDYEHAPLEGRKELYLLLRNYNCTLIDTHYENFAGKEFVHSSLGLRTFGMECERLGTHNRSHLEQVFRALDDAALIRQLQPQQHN